MVFDPAMCAANNILRAIIAVFELFGNLAIWQYGKTKGASLTFMGAYPDLAAVGCNNCLGQVEAQTGATNLRTIAVVAVEFIKNMANGRRRNTNPEVLDSSLNQALTILVGFDNDFFAAAAV